MARKEVSRFVTIVSAVPLGPRPDWMNEELTKKVGLLGFGEDSLESLLFL